MKEQLEAVRRMQDYIDAHLEESITLSDLARAALFSPWYAYRLFTRYTGKTPAEYIRKLRLSRSAMKLKEEHCRVTDAAFALGFESVDGFQRAFRRTFGCNPGEYARTQTPIPLFLPYRVQDFEWEKESNMTNDQTTQTVFVQLVRKPARKVLIKRGIKATHYFEYCAEVGCDVWGILRSMDSLSGEPVCLWLPPQYQKPHTSVYVQGVETEVDAAVCLPEGFDTILLPETEYLLFQGEPFEERDYAAAICAVQQAMDRYNPAVIGYAWDDTQPRIQLEPIGTRGYLELRAVRPLQK